MRPVFHPVAQHIDHAAFADLLFQPRQKSATRRRVLAQFQCGGEFRLRGFQEGAKMDEVNAIVAVVIFGLAREPTGADHIGDDQAFQSLFAGVGGITFRQGGCRKDVFVVLVKEAWTVRQPSLTIKQLPGNLNVSLLDHPFSVVPAIDYCRDVGKIRRIFSMRNPMDGRQQLHTEDVSNPSIRFATVKSSLRLRVIFQERFSAFRRFGLQSICLSGCLGIAISDDEMTFNRAQDVSIFSAYGPITPCCIVRTVADSA